MCRTSEEWYSSSMGQSVSMWLQENNGSPIKISSMATASESALWTQIESKKPLRVIDMSRVIAAPVAARALAAHGSDVLTISSIHLPNLPILELDTARGKRATSVDLDVESGRDELKRLIQESDVLLQAYRPGSLASKGISKEDVQNIRPGLIYAELDAYGFTGPWKDVRGFDSLLQCASGINLSEARSKMQYTSANSNFNVELASDLQPLVLPCQALDHSSGYLLAFGILAAKCRSLLEKDKADHNWHVQVSLATTAAWMGSLGRVHGKEAWENPCKIKVEDQEVKDLLEPYHLRGKEPLMTI